MKFCYGLIESYIDVSKICKTTLAFKHMITIPNGDDNRAEYFSDPCYGKQKSVFIFHENGHIDVFGEEYMVQINTLNNKIFSINANDICIKISTIQSQLKIDYGTFNDEYPEQRMSAMFLSGKEKVLEIGGNIGRNSLVIAHLLDETPNNLVVLESDPYTASLLGKNRDLNKFNFHIENSALSKRKLIQKGWDTLVSDTLPEGYKWVSTITWDELNAKYNIVFDTLVLDCEGAFYYILMDMPEILNNITLIIMENDYHDINHKKYVDEVLVKNNFEIAYMESGGWEPCYKNFFEVWKRL